MLIPVIVTTKFCVPVDFYAIKADVKMFVKMCGVDLALFAIRDVVFVHPVISAILPIYNLDAKYVANVTTMTIVSILKFVSNWVKE